MISLIVAHDNNLCIGADGDLPWGTSIKSDLKWFKQNTLNKTVVMGSNTFDSIGKPLSNRKNIVMTRDFVKMLHYMSKQCSVAMSADEVMDRHHNINEELFIIGGATLYEQFLSYADRLYITSIDAEFQGDTYFPEYNLSEYNIIYEEEVFDNYPLKFTIYEKDE